MPRQDSADVVIVPALTATPTSTPTPTPTPFGGTCPGTVTIYASKDTWIDGANPNDTHGSDYLLRTSYTSPHFQQILLYFPFDGVVPPDQHIYRAELQMVRDEMAAEQTNMSVYRLREPFDEYTVNWATYGYPNSARVSEQKQFRWEHLHTWDLLAQARRWHSGAEENHGLMIESLADTATWYLSRDHTHQNKPRLVIECGEAQPTETPTPTNTPTITPTPTVTPTRLPIDYRIDALQVTQGISTYQLQPALVARKSTFVLAFASAWESGAPVTANVGFLTLSATRGGQPLEPPRLSPISRPVWLRATGWDPAEIDDSYLFELPYDWLEGFVELTAELRVVDEDPSTLGNNTFTRLLAFDETPPICAMFVPVRTDSGSPSGGFMVYQQAGRAMVDRAVSLLPVEKFRTFVTDSVLEKVEWWGPVPVGYEAYDPVGDGSAILTGLWLRNALTDDPDSCEDAGSPVKYAGMVLEPDSPGKGGRAYVPGHELWFRLSSGGAGGYNGNLINKPLGGRFLAHELGHNFGNGHVGCNTEVTQAGYPYDECWFSEHSTHGPEWTYYGFDTLTHTVIAPDPNVGDLMSYNTLRYPSDFTWRRIHWSIDAVAASRSEAAANTSGALGELVLAVGILDPEGGPARVQRLSILDTSIIPASKQAQILLDPMHVDGEYRFRQLDSAAQLLADDSFDYRLAMNQNEEDQMFGFAVPLAHGAEIFEISHRGQTLFRKRASANRTVSWQADDRDGDVLLFDVQYSSDNGRTWKLLATEVLSTTITLDMETVAGSDGFGLVRVVGNDGVNSGHDSSDRRFTVGKKPPRVRITSHRDGDLIRPGVGFNLRGVASDAEDDYLEGRSLVWTHVRYGQLGTGEGVYVDGLEAGEHTFTLTGTDSDSQRDSDTITLRVSDSPRIYLPLLTRVG
jgi:hypothetical protein